MRARTPRKGPAHGETRELPDAVFVVLPASLMPPRRKPAAPSTSNHVQAFSRKTDGPVVKVSMDIVPAERVTVP